MTKARELAILAVYGDARNPEIAPRCHDAASYDQVAAAGWGGLLEPYQCLVLGPPWGTIIKTPPPRLRSASGKYLNEIVAPDNRLTVDSSLLRSGELWSWLRTRKATVIWALPDPADLHVLEYEDQEGITSVEYLEPLQHALHPNYLFANHRHRHGKVWCCPGPIGPAPNALHLDWTIHRQASDFVAGSGGMGAVLEAIARVNGSLPEFRLEASPTHQWYGSKVDFLRTQREHTAGGGDGKEPSALGALSALILQRHNEAAGAIVRGFIGLGQLVIVPARMPKSLQEAEELLSASRTIHCAVHEDLRSLLPGEEAGPPGAGMRILSIAFLERKRGGRREVAFTLKGPDGTKSVSDDMSLQHAAFLKAIFDARPKAVPYSAVSRALWGASSNKRGASQVEAGVFKGLHSIRSKMQSALRVEVREEVRRRIEADVRVGFRWVDG